jgi:ATP synthase protein I
VALVIESKPIRTVLRWQLYATAASMSIAAIWMGTHGALSALAGGLVNVTAGAVSALLASVGRQAERRPSAGTALITLMRAEAAKVALIVAQLWLILAFYEQVVPVFFFGTFILTVIIFSLSIFVRSR